MKKISLILLNLVVLLIYFNYSVAQKESILKDGKLVLLALAPVDPRSLMQGDYMTLNYELSTDIISQQLPKRGYAVLRVDDHQVGHLVRFQAEREPLQQGEQLIAYSNPNDWQLHIGAESFFFQEGHAERYSEAKYGGLRIDDKGNSLLIGLFDEHKKQIN